MVDRSIKKLVCYGLSCGLIKKRDEIYATNRLMEILNIDSLNVKKNSAMLTLRKH